MPIQSEPDIHTALVRNMFDEHIKSSSGGTLTGLRRSQSFVHDFATTYESVFGRAPVIADLLEFEAWRGYNMAVLKHTNSPLRINCGVVTMEKIQNELHRLAGKKMICKKIGSTQDGFPRD